MLTLVSYDVVDDRRRTKLAKILKDFGARVQFSVFECRLTADQLGVMTLRLSKVIDESKDSVRIYRLCNDCAPKTVIVGTGVLTEDPDVYVV